VTASQRPAGQELVYLMIDWSADELNHAATISQAKVQQYAQTAIYFAVFDAN
jgi:hypothetical protein